MSIFDKYEVRPIPFSWAKIWIVKRHYARRVPNIRFCFGVFDDQKQLGGIMTLGYPPNPSVAPAICGDEYKNIVYEFNRLCIDDNMPANTGSFFVSKVIKSLEPPKILVSFSDINQGHVGYIYQATNWLYTGMSNPDRVVIVDGKEVHYRLLRWRGVTSIEDLKNKYGDRKVEIKKIKPKHRYIYFIAESKKQRKQMMEALKYDVLPYPKGDTIRYDAGKSKKGIGFIYKI